MKKLKFSSEKSLLKLIESYFGLMPDDQKIKDEKPEPPTVAGLALFLGFNSKEDFDSYELKGKYAAEVKRARFRVMAYYESRLHYPAPTGAMFALKSMGWYEKTSKKPRQVKSLKVQLIETGPNPASSEKEVEQ
ncbi:hypothetical protein FO440_10695 [Mucilaginibacter corticis]|uniref:Uncharacterized protein n=1 Tax=Mucilaginibacter corticis TaxID=2597670 RepID=A0A556MK73_9SPHI|nr:terminase small subunit [Mucilaginibacter corticis]TSJ40225.1 hypothetical protein FO440_10695 [Mucilaginibacter corticis]